MKKLLILSMFIATSVAHADCVSDCLAGGSTRTHCRMTCEMQAERQAEMECVREVDRQASLKRECFSPEQCLKVIMHDLNDDTKYDKCKNW